jgi:transposase
MHDGTFETFKASRRERGDIRVGVERRRRWSREEKLRIVRDSLEPGAIVTEVARRNEVSASLIYSWRRQALAGVMEGFHRIEVVSETRRDGVADDPDTISAVTMLAAPTPKVMADHSTQQPPATLGAAQASPLAGPRPAIEVTLPGGAVVRVDGAADVKAFRAVLGVLVAR